MTQKQKQALLLYLGYYTGQVDGLWGPKSKAAMDQFRKATGLREDDPKTLQTLRRAVYESNPDTFWADIPNFQRREFRCKCGGKYCTGFPSEPEEKLVRLLQRVRGYFDRPVLISSGLRCVTHNQKVGGVANSRHIQGKAVDFCVRDLSAQLVLPYVQQLPGVRYAYAIDSNFVHMDVQ